MHRMLLVLARSLRTTDIPTCILRELGELVIMIFNFYKIILFVMDGSPWWWVVKAHSPIMRYAMTQLCRITNSFLTMFIYLNKKHCRWRACVKSSWSAPANTFTDIGERHRNKFTEYVHTTKFGELSWSVNTSFIFKNFYLLNIYFFNELNFGVEQNTLSTSYYLLCSEFMFIKLRYNT